MDLVEKIEIELKEKYGNFDTDLELLYKVKLIHNLINGTTKEKLFWATYNQVVIELKKNFSDTHKFGEMLYNLTETEIDSVLCLEIIEDLKSNSLELSRLYNKIKNF